MDRARVPDDAAANALQNGEIEVLAMPWSSNATYLGEVCCGDDCGPGGLQAAARRTSALGLPVGARPPRGGRLRAVGGAGLGPGPLTILPRRAARRGIGAAVRRRPTSSSTTSRSTRTKPHHDQLRRCAPSIWWATTPTARAATACSGSTDGSRHRQRPDVPPEFKLRTVIWEFGGEDDPRRSARGRRALAGCRAAGPAGGAARPVRARRRAGPRCALWSSRLLPDRRDRPSLPLAARLTSKRLSPGRCRRPPVAGRG